MGKLQTFFSSGSCSDEDLIIKGTFKNGIYTSELISGSYEQEFYNRLAEKAKLLKKYIYLMY